MSMGGGTTTGSAQPYAPSQPYLSGLLPAAQGIYNSQGPYPGLSPTTQGAMSLTANRALAGSPLVQTAQNTVQNMAAGGATNPYLDQMANTALGKVRDMTMGEFTAAGRTGSGANQQELTRNLGDVANQIYGGQYNNDQNRTLAAAQLAPGLANQDYGDLSKLLGVGQMQDQWNQQAYNQPWSNLNNLAGLVGNVAGAGRTTSQTAPSQSIVPSLLGSALQGYGSGGFLDSLFGNQGSGGMFGGLLGTTGGTYDGGLGGASFAGDYGGSGLLGSLGSLFG